MRALFPLALIPLGAVALAASLPFLVWHHAAPLGGFYAGWLAVALGLVAALALLWPSAWRPLPLPRVVLAPLGLAAVLGMQVALGHAVYWQEHAMGVLVLLWAALLMLAGAQLRREFGLARLATVLAAAVLIGALLSAGAAVLQAAGTDRYVFVAGHRAGPYAGNFAEAAHQAGYLTLALAALLYLHAAGRVGAVLAAALAALLLGALALTGTALAWVWLALLAAWFWVAVRRAAGDAWLALWLLPAYAALQALLPHLVADAPAPIWQQAGALAQALQNRLELAAQAWHIFLAHPWLGAGYGQFGWQDFLLAEQFPGHTGHTPHPGNSVLHLLAETGAAGVAAFVIGLALWLRGAAGEAASGERWWLLAVLGLLALMSLAGAPLWSLPFLGLAALLLGAGEARPALIRLRPGPLFAAVIVAAGAFALVDTGMHYRTLERWQAQQAATGRTGLHPRQAAAMLDDLTVIRSRSLFAAHADAMVAALLLHEPRLAPDLLALDGPATQVLPHAPALYRQALLLALAGEPEAAMTQLRLARLRHPAHADDFAVQLLRRADPRTLPLMVDLLRKRQAP